MVDYGALEMTFTAGVCGKQGRRGGPQLGSRGTPGRASPGSGSWLWLSRGLHPTRAEASGRERCSLFPWCSREGLSQACLGGQASARGGDASI